MLFMCHKLDPHNQRLINLGELERISTSVSVLLDNSSNVGFVEFYFPMFALIFASLHYIIVHPDQLFFVCRYRLLLLFFSLNSFFMAFWLAWVFFFENTMIAYVQIARWQTIQIAQFISVKERLWKRKRPINEPYSHTKNIVPNHTKGKKIWNEAATTHQVPHTVLNWTIDQESERAIGYWNIYKALLDTKQIKELLDTKQIAFKQREEKKTCV